VSPRRIALYALAAFAIWWVVTSPAQAAHLVHQGGSAVSHGARSLTTFATSIASSH
jgi:hypothetical protein